MNKYSAFRCKSGYKSVRPKFTFHAYPVHDQDLCAKWTKANHRIDCRPICHVPSSHALPTRAVHTIVDRYALHCRRCKVIVVVKQLSHSARRMERRQVSDDVYIVGRKQPASDFFRAVLYPYVHSQCEKDGSGRCTFIFLTS